MLKNAPKGRAFVAMGGAKRNPWKAADLNDLTSKGSRKFKNFHQPFIRKILFLTSSLRLFPPRGRGWLKPNGEPHQISGSTIPAAASNTASSTRYRPSSQPDTMYGSTLNTPSTCP